MKIVIVKRLKILFRKWKKDNDIHNINQENKFSELTNKFVQRIVGAIKKGVRDYELLMNKSEWYWKKWKKEKWDI